MRQPDDESPQQIIRIVERNGDNGMFSRFMQAVLLAITLAIGTGLWTMNSRLTKVETLLEIMAKDQGVKIPK